MRITQEEISQDIMFAIDDAFDHWVFEETLSGRLEEQHSNTGIVKVSNGQRFLVTVTEIPSE
jgi:hypothetical protein